MINERGYATFLLLSLLPFFVTVLVLLGYWGSYLKTSESLQHTCRRELLLSQQEAGIRLEILLALNSAAKALRLEKRMAEFAILTALSAANPTALAAALNWYQGTINQQQVLDKIQRGLLIMGNASLWKGALLAKSKLAAKSTKLKKKWSHFVNIEARAILVAPGKLAVHPDIESEIAPIYELDQNFTQQQGSQVFWKRHTSILPTQWTSNWSKAKFSIPESCSASLEKKGTKWIAKLVRSHNTMDKL